MKAFVLSTNQANYFRRTLLVWYRKFGRTLPWRKTHNPYFILVSEIMLQQTQVDRVISKYQAWLKRFPTVEALASAPTADVLHEWSGLGYNRRALALQKTAHIIANEYDGVFPDTLEVLMKLPGIGKYTASAVLSFAFRKPVPIVDTNVKRVLGRIFFGYTTLAKYIDTDEPFWELKQRVVPKNPNAYDFNQGIMDFGAMVCTARQPKCEICPMRKVCKSYPEILTADSKLLRVKRKRLEPLFFGQPQRIWRGKILQVLKNNTTKTVSLNTIGTTIQTDWKPDRMEWLQAVIESLAKDKLITIQSKGKNWKVHLPQ